MVQLAPEIRWGRATQAQPTPNEGYFQTPKARDGPRFEPRPMWPLDEGVSLRAEKGAPLKLVVTFLEGRRHLPLVELKAAA